MKFQYGKVLGAAAVTAMTLAPLPASAASTLEQVKARGSVNCQVGRPEAGTFMLSPEGVWYGRDVAVCRAVAAAIFGDPSKVEFQIVAGGARFTSLANGESDLMVRAATNTLKRETQLGLDFTTVNFYDGQGFMVPKSSGIKSALELDGATVCMDPGTTGVANVADFASRNKITINPLMFQDRQVRLATYLKGGCDAITTDRSGLASDRASFPNPDEHEILPETISKEPLGAFVRQGDSQWRNIVTWVVHAMVTAEEIGLTSKNIDEAKAKPQSADQSRFLGLEGDLNVGLGLSPEWAYNIIKHVGNYGEVYDLYMGDGPEGGPKGMGIPRAGSLNASYIDGGLIFAPPFN
ncbi:amino acid ABC transporter substrate-binding protein [Shinella zoogloeoides]|uniref:amino acid ABC transporter substrate-binding protein n=1 Tax=Shinella zoogloeoides TaxID=352475 RepID=UPI001F568C4C|nr:amino acid ABC transporter substrate-binding protein [Shinella zoogloeoides]